MNKMQGNKPRFNLSSISLALSHNRLGEILVSRGFISTHDLRRALKIQKNESRPLGEIFLESSLISKRQLATVLVRQFVLRSLATLLLGTTMWFGGLNSKRALADIQDVPAKISASFNSSAKFAPLETQTAVFGTQEKRSTNLKPFTKWSQMFAKFDRQMKAGEAGELVAHWKEALKRYEGESLKEMAEGVNNFINRQEYIIDNRNWGQSDYWATPVEFMQRGGDCEDYAIAKYTALRALGVPEERLRIAIVQDTQKNIPHAILIVFTDQGTYALDNQIKSLVDADSPGRYRPIYSINRTAWWLHITPETTRIASR